MYIISLKINLFSPWYSWWIAELALNNNHSLTHSLTHSLVVKYKIYFMSFRYRYKSSSVFLSCFVACAHVFYIDNVCILYLSCNVKFSIQLPNCLRRTETRFVLIVPSKTSALKMLSFLIVTQHESGTKKTYLDQWSYITKNYQVNAIWLLK